MEIGAIIHRFKSCTSTNDLAKEMALRGEREGTVVLSEAQTQGRGTKGRQWFSRRKKGLYLSIILRPKNPYLSLLPLVAGLAARDAIFQTARIQVGFKWPNDLIWEKRKLGGILCESSFLGDRVNYAILGIGLNLSHRINDFPEEIRQTATSLRMIARKEVDKDSLLTNLLMALSCWYEKFNQGKAATIIRRAEKNMIFHKGKKLTVLQDKQKFIGIFRGLDKQGGLILEVKSKRVSFYSAECIIINEE